MLAQTFTSSAAGWPVVVACVALVGVVLAVVRWLGLGTEREVLVATGRAAVQLLAVGALFTLVFTSSLAWLGAWAWLALMTGVAHRAVVRRTSHREGRVGLAAAAAIVGSLAVGLGLTFALGVIDLAPIALVVVAGITIGNAVPAAVQGVDQTRIACRDGRGAIEALLATGADRRMVVRAIAPRAARATLVPQVERTKVVGLIALPGAMTGLLLAGVDPVEAVVVQLLVMYLVLATAAVCVAATVVAVATSALTPDLRVADWAAQPER